MSNDVLPLIVYTKDRLYSLEKDKDKMAMLYGPNSSIFKAFQEKLTKAREAHSQALKAA